MAWTPDIWTPAARRLLYDRVVALFGPYETWELKGSPGNGKNDEFHEFCDVFARAVGAKSADAVRHQIAFALPSTASGSTWKAQAQTAILNKAAALEAGFIENKHIPELLAVGREEVEPPSGASPKAYRPRP